MAKIGNFTITDYDENKSDNVELWKYELNELLLVLSISNSS